MTTITLHLDTGHPRSIPVVMNGATFGKHALKRCLERINIDPDKSHLYKLVASPGLEAIPDDEIIAAYDGRTVHIWGVNA